MTVAMAAPAAPHMEPCHEQQVPEHVEHRRNSHGDQGHFRVPDAPKHAAQNVVGHDEHRSAAADAGIGNGLGESLRRGVQKPRRRRREPLHGHGQDQPHAGEGEDGGAHHRAAVFLPLLAYVLAQKHRGAHGQLREDHGKRLHELAAHRHRRHVGGVRELPHDHQIHRPVQGLDQHGEHDGEYEPHQRRHDLSLGEITFHISLREKAG